MRVRRFLSAAAAAALCGSVLLPAAKAAPPSAAELVGTAVPDFSLPSQQGTLVNYFKDYYGKHALVLTFFPAAFTPV